MIDTINAMEEVMAKLHKEFETVKSGKGWYSAAQRARVDSLELEKLGKQFRKESIAATKEAKGM